MHGVILQGQPLTCLLLAQIGDFEGVEVALVQLDAEQVVVGLPGEDPLEQVLTALDCDLAQRRLHKLAVITAMIV